MGTPHRILYILPPTRSYAGIERVVHEIASYLAEVFPLRAEIHVAFCTEYENAELQEPPYARHLLAADRLRSMIRPIRQLVQTIKPDLVICPQIEPTIAVWVATRLIGRRTPLVTHLHGNPQVESTEGNFATKIAFFAFKRYVSKNLVAVLAVSPGLQSYAQKRLVSGVDVLFCRNPVRAFPTAAAATTSSEQQKPAKFEFLSVGRLDRQKGFDVLLDAISMLPSEVLSSVHFTILGSGPDQGQLTELAGSLGITCNVSFISYTEHPDIYYKRADCLVLSSRWEGSPLVVLEALSFGLPVLATDCPFGPSDVIVDPKLGRLVPSESPGELRDGMLQELQRRACTGDSNFRRDYAQMFSVENSAIEHLAIVEKIIDKLDRNTAGQTD